MKVKNTKISMTVYIYEHKKAAHNTVKHCTSYLWTTY